MNRKKIAVKASLFTLILALMVTIAYAAVTNKGEDSMPQSSTTYFYNGPSNDLENDVMDPAKWGTSQSSGLSCGHSTEIPCSLSVPAGKTISQRLTELNDLAGVQGATATRRNPSL